MINSVSGVHFGNNVDLAAPGKYSQASSAKAEAKADEFVGKKKSKAPSIIGGIAALAVAGLVTLGILSGKGKLTKVEGAEKFMDKAKNALAGVGEWVAEKSTNCWNWAKGLFGGKKGEQVADAVEEIVEQAAK